MLKKLLILMSTLVALGTGFYFTLIPEADSGQKIILEVQFLEEGTKRVLAEPTHLEGDQGVFASIEVPVQIRDDYTIVSQGFDEPSTNLINQGQFYGNKLVYQIFFKKVEKQPEVPQQGPFTLNVEEYDKAGKNYQLNYPDAIGTDGKPIRQGASQSTDFATNFGYYTIDEDHVVVWCYDPHLPARNGAKYEKVAVAENEDAALIQNFGIGYQGHDKSHLLASTEQRLLWELQGNTFPKNPYVIERDKDGSGNYSNSKLRQLDATEEKEIKDFENRIKELTALYKSGKKVDWTLKSGDALGFKDNTFGVIGDGKERELVVSANSEDGKKLIQAYKNGSMTVAQGVTITFNGEDIRIKVPGTLAAGVHDLVSFSMIRDSYVGDSYEYQSNYGGQPLQVNRIKNPKMDTLKLEVLSPEPTKPTEPTKPGTVPVKPIEPLEPIKPNPVNPLVEPVEPNEPKKPTPPASLVIELEPIKPTQPLEPVKPTGPELPKTTEPKAPVKPTEPSLNGDHPRFPDAPKEPTKPNVEKPTAPNAPVAPTKPKEPVNPDAPAPTPPAEPTKPGIAPVTPVDGSEKPVEPMKPTAPKAPSVAPVAPTNPSEPTKPNEPMKPNEPKAPTDGDVKKPVQPTEPTKPSQPNQPVEPTKPVQPNEPTEPNKPVEPTKPGIEPNEPNKPAEPSKPNEPNKPVEPSKPSVNEPVAPNKPNGKAPVKPENKELPKSGDVSSVFSLFAGVGTLGLSGVTKRRKND